jgi:hypothetical protein
MLEFHEAGDPDVKRPGYYHFFKSVFNSWPNRHDPSQQEQSVGKVNSETATEMNEQAKK